MKKDMFVGIILCGNGNFIFPTYLQEESYVDINSGVQTMARENNGQLILLQRLTFEDNEKGNQRIGTAMSVFTAIDLLSDDCEVEDILSEIFKAGFLAGLNVGSGRKSEIETERIIS